MKTNLHLLSLFLLLGGIFVLHTSYSEYETYVPVFMKRADLENSVSYQVAARDMENPGKIYYKSPYIYINERYKGIHVINNSDPYHPVKEGFIVAPGCIDMAVKGNILYLDNSVDLVAFNLNTKQVTKRIKAVFPEPQSPDNRYYHHERTDEYVIVGWKKNVVK